MLDSLIHIWSKHNKTAIACLGLVPLVISCAGANNPEPASAPTASSAPQETVVAEETASPQPAPATSEPVAAASASSSPVTQPQNTIPFPFQGEWNVSLESCGVPYSDGRLMIAVNRIDFYESSGNVQQVAPQGDLGMRVTAEYFSEGETFTDTDSFQLSSDRATLTHTDSGAVRYRCSG